MKSTMILRALLLFLGTLFLASGCTPKQLINYSNPPIENRGRSPEKVRLDSRETEKTAKIVADTAEIAMRSVNSIGEFDLVCIKKENWIEKKTNERGRDKEVIIHSKVSPLFGTDEGLLIEATYKYIQESINEINKEFGEFNSLVLLSEQMSGDTTILGSTITQGITVLYRASFFLATLRQSHLLNESCSFEPFRQYIQVAEDIVDETANIRLERLISRLKSMQITEEPFLILYYRLVTQALQGKSIAEECEKLSQDSPSSDHKLLSDIFSWCGYAARSSGNSQSAKSYWDKGKRLLGRPEATSYATKMLKVLAEEK
jgi:hypothetical protein